MESIDQPDSYFRPRPAASPDESTAPPGYPPPPPVQQPHLPASAPPAGKDRGYDSRLTWKTGLLGLAFAIGAVFMLSIFFAIALALGAEEDSSGFNFVANLAQDFLLLGAALVAVRGVVDRVTPETLGFRGLKWSGVGWATLAFFFFLLVAAVYSTVVQVDDQSVEDTGLSAPLLIVFAVGVAPIVEEVFFRGFLFRSFRNGLGVIGSALVTGLLFGSVHAGGAPVEALPLLAFFGVLLALLYERTRSLWPCILLHLAYNSLVMVVILTG